MAVFETMLYVVELAYTSKPCFMLGEHAVGLYWYFVAEVVASIVNAYFCTWVLHTCAKLYQLLSTDCKPAAGCGSMGLHHPLVQSDKKGSSTISPAPGPAEVTACWQRRRKGQAQAVHPCCSCGHSCGAERGPHCTY